MVVTNRRSSAEVFHMRKKLSVVGNSLGLVIEKPILELLKIDRDTEIDVTTDGNRLILEPVRKERKKRLSDAHEKVMRQHDATFRKLAK
jgi:antitoxin MazE